MSDAARRGGAEEETAMVIAMKRSGALVLRLIAGLALLGWPRVSSAQRTWSVISLPQRPDEVVSQRALALAPDADRNEFREVSRLPGPAIAIRQRGCTASAEAPPNLSLC